MYRAQSQYWDTGYFGRGFVPLTWESNYKRFATVLGLDLLGNPDLALDPETAAKFICLGMTRGFFTGRSLKDFFNGSKVEWTNARKIINGLDKAHLFADRAKKIVAA